MDRLYFNKIKDQEINFKTGEIWRAEDVPSLWRERVREMLNELSVN